MAFALCGRFNCILYSEWGFCCGRVSEWSINGSFWFMFSFPFHIVFVVVKGLRSFGDLTRELLAVLTRCFTVTFVCRLKRRVGALLGIEHQWTGDACCCLFA